MAAVQAQTAIILPDFPQKWPPIENNPSSGTSSALMGSTIEHSHRVHLHQQPQQHQQQEEALLLPDFLAQNQHMMMMMHCHGLQGSSSMLNMALNAHNNMAANQRQSNTINLVVNPQGNSTNMAMNAQGNSINMAANPQGVCGVDMATNAENKRLNMALNANQISSLSGYRKRVREEEEVSGKKPRQELEFLSDVLQQQRQVFAGLHDGTNQAPSSMASTSGRPSALSAVSAVLVQALQHQSMMQKQELDQLIQAQGEHMKQVIEKRRQKLAWVLIACVERAFAIKMKEKEEEVQRVSTRNLELEERIRQLSLESQLWQHMARSNEAMVSNLKSSLEQAMAASQTREQGKEAHEAEDAQSCNHGGESNCDMMGSRMMAGASMQEMQNGPERRCRVCRASKDVCVLLLPCRHLCLCKNCDAKTSYCPICAAYKNASVQVYLN